MPSPSIEMLRRRAELFARTREFFAARGVLEVDTAILGHGLVVESMIDPVPCRVRRNDEGKAERRWLLSSPEGPMKRLLAAGSGPIYQIAHAFRDGETGRRHACEFTLLEWYRPGFDHHQLMDEVEDLVRALAPSVGTPPFERRSYRQVFQDTVGIDPFATSHAELRATCERLSVPVPQSFDTDPLDDALDLLLVSVIEAQLGQGTPLFLHDYPASQAALAQVHDDDHRNPVAQRFELYIDGIELCNGYHELLDASEQRHRFEQSVGERAARGRAPLPIDEDLLAALEQGLPPCAGVALGLDRLLMAATGTEQISDVRPLHPD